jgi:hypothetical protein
MHYIISFHVQMSLISDWVYRYQAVRDRRIQLLSNDAYHVAPSFVVYGLHLPLSAIPSTMLLSMATVQSGMYRSNRVIKVVVYFNEPLLFVVNL